MNAFNEAIWSAEADDAREATLNRWISEHQPCLFGRAAATAGTMSYCILSDSDLEKDDAEIQAKIQERRLLWTRRAFDGLSSGFVVLLASRTVSFAPPSELFPLAARFCKLYLEIEPQENSIHLEDVILQKPGRTSVAWLFRAGVNFFAAQGDGRWWRDHRVPAGIAFSVNSVGHMVRSNYLSQAMAKMDEGSGTNDGWKAPNVASLPRALFFAMQTIANASQGPNGPATWLVDRTERDRVRTCPIDLPRSLETKSMSSYEGLYHTDFTLPSEYFSNAPEPAENQEIYELDFTYLFDDSLENPDHRTVAKGRRIREAASRTNNMASARRLRVIPETVAIRSMPRLVAALRLRPNA